NANVFGMFLLPQTLPVLRTGIGPAGNGQEFYFLLHHSSALSRSVVIADVCDVTECAYAHPAASALEMPFDKPDNEMAEAADWSAPCRRRPCPALLPPCPYYKSNSRYSKAPTFTRICTTSRWFVTRASFRAVEPLLSFRFGSAFASSKISTDCG